MNGSTQGEFDVAEAMQEIRRKAREKRREKTPKTGKVPATGVVVSQERLHEEITELARAADEINRRWLVQELPFVSRFAVLGPLIARFREAWNSVACRWHVRRILEQQVQFNSSLAEYSKKTVLCVGTLGDEVKALDDNLRAADRRQLDLVRLVDESNQNLEERLKDLEGLYHGLVRDLALEEASDPEGGSAPVPSSI